MVGDAMAHTEAIVKLAHAELAAFLRGTEAGIGQGDQQERGNTWIETLISRDWTEHNYPGFFRAVTILTILQLVSDEQPRTPREARKGEKHDVGQPLISV